MIKRVADFSEKIAAGSFLIGLFQDQTLAVVLGLLTFAISLALTWGLERRMK
jgi:hypothetical protein